MLELIVVLSVLTTGLALALPALNALRQDLPPRAAARYLASRAMLARARAVRSGAAVGIRFERTREGYQFAEYLDRNGNGIRAQDIRQGVDPLIHRPQHLSDQFSGVHFGLDAGVPAIGDSAAAGVDFDPVRLGAGDTLTYSPVGTATSGTLYIRGASGRQYAVRILGITGRIRVFRFDRTAGVWEAR